MRLIGWLRAAIAVGAAVLVGCTECPEQACDAAEAPRARGGIARGISGVIAYRTDACEQSCCECNYDDAELLVWRTETPVETMVDALAYVTGPESDIDVRIKAHHSFERELDAGDYLVCHGSFNFSFYCAPVHLGQRDVFTVNVQKRYGPPSLLVFGPGDSEPRDEAVIRVDVDMQ